jgi:hypothetical protein
MEELRSRIVLYSGFILAFSGLAGIFSGLEPLASFAAPLLWWAYITLSDSLLLSLKGESLMVSRTDDFLWMAACSAAAWLVLEAVNAGLGVWQYINLPAQAGTRWAWYLGLGSAMLPALHQSAAYLSPVKPAKSAPAPLRLSERALDGMQAAGVLFFFLPFFFPRLAFPLAALALPLILDPLNFRLKVPSLLGLLERGERGKIAALAAAGLVCGLAGEAWLYAGGPSRVYDLGYAGGPPFMSLPLTGYAAFPFLAFAAFSLYSLALFARGGGAGILGEEIRAGGARPAWLPPAAYAALFLIYYAGVLLVDARSAALLTFLH